MSNTKAWIPADPSDYSRMTSRDLLVEAAMTAHDNSTVLFELQEDDCTDKQLADLTARITEMKEDVSSLKAEMVEMKAEMSEMQSNISTLKADLTDARRDLALAVTELQEARRAIVSLVELMRREKEN